MRFREANKLLTQNGWRVVRVKGSHYHYQHREFQHIVTLTVHGHASEISQNVLSSLRKSTGLAF